MNEDVSTFFSHLFIQAPGAGRISLLSYVDLLFPYADAARRADRAEYIRRTIASFHELERSTLASRVTVDGVDYQALPAAGAMDPRSLYFGEPMNFLALGHTVQTRAAVRDYFDTITRVASLDYRLCWVLDRPRRRCERVLIVIADQHSHFGIRQLLQRQRKAVSDWMLDSCSEKLLAAVVTHCGRPADQIRSLQNPLALWKFIYLVTSPFTKILSEQAFQTKFHSFSSPTWSVFKREFLELLETGSRIPDFSLPSPEAQFKRVREMIRCYPEQDDYKRATIDLMSSAPTIRSLSDLFSFLDSLQQTTDVMKLSHQEALNHNHVGGRKEKVVNEHTVIQDRDASRSLLAASPSSSPSSVEQKCRACNEPWSPSHRDTCPAKDKHCCDCGRKGHFAGSEWCALQQQKPLPSSPSPPLPPSALKKLPPKAAPVASEEDKKKARDKKIAAAIKLLSEENPTALSVPSSPPLSSNAFQLAGQGHYSSVQQMLPTPYYSSYPPPPPPSTALRISQLPQAEEERRMVRFDPPGAPSASSTLPRRTGMLATFPIASSLASLRSPLSVASSLPFSSLSPPLAPPVYHIPQEVERWVERPDPNAPSAFSSFSRRTGELSLLPLALPRCSQLSAFRGEAPPPFAISSLFPPPSATRPPHPYNEIAPPLAGVQHGRGIPASGHGGGRCVAPTLGKAESEMAASSLSSADSAPSLAEALASEVGSPIVEAFLSSNIRRIAEEKRLVGQAVSFFSPSGTVDYGALFSSTVGVSVNSKALLPLAADVPLSVDPLPPSSIVSIPPLGEDEPFHVESRPLGSLALDPLPVVPPSSPSPATSLASFSPHGGGELVYSDSQEEKGEGDFEQHPLPFMPQKKAEKVEDPGDDADDRCRSPHHPRLKLCALLKPSLPSMAFLRNKYKRSPPLSSVGREATGHALLDSGQALAGTSSAKLEGVTVRARHEGRMTKEMQ